MRLLKKIPNIGNKLIIRKTKPIIKREFVDKVFNINIFKGDSQIYWDRGWFWNIGAYISSPKLIVLKN